MLVDENERPFHRYPGHDLESCYTLRDVIYDLNDQNRLDWNEIDAIFGASPRNLERSSVRSHDVSIYITGCTHQGQQ